jgi:hypothetical protein
LRLLGKKKGKKEKASEYFISMKMKMRTYVRQKVMQETKLRARGSYIIAKASTCVQQRTERLISSAVPYLATRRIEKKLCVCLLHVT